MKKILCVDDATYTLASIKEALSDRFEVFLARDSQTALQYGMDEDIDLIIIDPLIERDDGIELLKYLAHADSRYFQIPIIVLTTELSDTQKIALEPFDVEAVLSKPCVVSILQRNVEDAMRRIELNK